MRTTTYPKLTDFPNAHPTTRLFTWSVTILKVRKTVAISSSKLENFDVKMTDLLLTLSDPIQCRSHDFRGNLFMLLTWQENSTQRSKQLISMTTGTLISKDSTIPCTRVLDSIYHVSQKPSVLVHLQFMYIVHELAVCPNFKWLKASQPSFVLDTQYSRIHLSTLPVSSRTFYCLR